MYREMDNQISFMQYTLKDEFTINSDNRWVKKAEIMPWNMAEEKYSHMFRKNGRPAKDVRMALGALIIQQTLEISDEELTEQIAENPYLQYFIGLKKFVNKCPFDSSLLVWFRKRLSAKFMAELNEAMCKNAAQPKEEKTEEDKKKDDNRHDDKPHGGTLILDASCVPSDVAYPTDTGLLGKSIEKAEEMIDEMHEPDKGKKRRPRTYRQNAHKVFLAISKQRKPRGREIRKCTGKLLRFLRRDLKIINHIKNTSETVIAVSIFAMNLSKRLRSLLRFFSQFIYETNTKIQLQEI